MTKDEALKLALEALERCVATCFDPYAHEQAMSWPEHFVNQTITAIKEALAQPEQKPVAWMTEDECEVYTSKQVDGCFQHDHIPLYTTPPQRKPLTDEEIHSVRDSFGEDPVMLVAFARAIEAAHGIKEKNT